MIYADYNATTPVLPEVRDAMLRFLDEEFGNPSSKAYSLGKRAAAAVQYARSQVAQLLNAHEDEVVFVSGGTESCFSAFLGAALAEHGNHAARTHCLYSAVEHPAVVEAAAYLARFHNFEIDEVPVSRIGSCSLEQVVEKLRPSSLLGSFMLANNETGAIFPVAEIAHALRAQGVLTHTDATQAVGKLPIQFHELGVDFLSCSGHKFGAPKGVGILLIRRDTPWIPIIRGGSQEKGRRGGTEATAAIAGIGAAANSAHLKLQQGYRDAVAAIRDAFEEELRTLVPDVSPTIATGPRLANTSSLSLPGVAGHELVEKLGEKGVYISAGSACKTGTAEPSRVLRATGRSIFDCLSTIRVSFGVASTNEEALLVARAIADEYETLRQNMR